MLTTTQALLCSNALCGQKPSWMSYLQSFSSHLLPQTGFIPQISCQVREEWTLYEGNKKALSLEHASGRWLVSGSPASSCKIPFHFPAQRRKAITFVQRRAGSGVYVGWFLSYSWVRESLLCHLWLLGRLPLQVGRCIIALAVKRGSQLVFIRAHLCVGIESGPWGREC